MRYSIKLQKDDHFQWRGYIEELSLEAHGHLDLVVQKLQEAELSTIQHYINGGIDLPPPSIYISSKLKKRFILFCKYFIKKIANFLIYTIIIVTIFSGLYPTIKPRIYQYIESGNLRITTEKFSNYLGINVCKK